VQSAALAFIVGVVAASAARAQDLCSWCAVLQGRYEGGAVQLEFSWTYWDLSTEAAGFDVYRGQLGTKCAEGVRVNNDVLPIPPNPTSEPAQIFMDSNVEPGPKRLRFSSHRRGATAGRSAAITWGCNGLAPRSHRFSRHHVLG